MRLLEMLIQVPIYVLKALHALQGLASRADCFKLRFGVFVLAGVVSGTATGFGTTEVFRYRDSNGRAVFTDRSLGGNKYTLIWRKSLQNLDATFERAPHLPMIVDSDAGSRSGRSSRSSGSKSTWRRRAEFSPIIANVAKTVHINPHLIHAVVQAESAYNPNARSHAGAMGLMQLMPATARRYGVRDILDPEQNLTGGARYIRDLLELFDNDLRLVLAAYNAGEGAVLKYGNQIPPYKETREYVRKVIANYRKQRGDSDS